MRAVKTSRVLWAMGLLTAFGVLLKYWPFKRASGLASALASVGPAEGYAPREGQTTCDPSPKPGVKMFRDFVITHYGGYDAGIARECSIGGNSEHKEGRAWDWGILKWSGHTAVPKSTIEGFLADLLANDAELARRAGIMYMIFNRRIWSSDKPTDWRPYSGSSPHTDHVHFSFSWAAAKAETSFYRGLSAGVIA